MWLRTRMFLLIAALFAILYGVVTGLGAWAGVGNAYFYLLLAFEFPGIQYLTGPSIVGWTMKVRWVSEAEVPELMAPRQQKVRLSGSEKIVELFTTHPNVLKRVRHLATLMNRT